MSSAPQSSIPQEGKLVNIIPVSLKEAALDSPSFRATVFHFSDQIDYIERWLDSYIKSATRFTTEISSLENVHAGMLAHLTSPLIVSEAVLDQDYAILAMKLYGETFKEGWSGMIAATKKLETQVVEPIRAFIQGELRSFKELRRNYDLSQKQYDQLQARYSSLGKSKEPSSLREDAFQLHEARKAYLKASLDFCVQSPQIKILLEKLFVNAFFDHWREFRTVRDNWSTAFVKFGQDMERSKGWTNELEMGEKAARRDLFLGRKQIEDAAELAVRPSRELEDYAVSTVPYLGSHGLSSFKVSETHTFTSEKHGWLNLRIFTGKPTRTVWLRRWAFLKDGIFGCLIQNPRTGGVEETERIGVLLCSVRPAFQEERRFCFEVKTKNNTIMLQAETQMELTDWIGSFEAAKRKALESPSGELQPFVKGNSPDPAFAISQPPAPEFTADSSYSLTPNSNDEQGTSDRGLPSPFLDRDGLAVRSSGDFTTSRRSTGPERDTESGRDHASRIISKLDIHRKSVINTPVIPPPSPNPQATGVSGLLSATHQMFPLGVPKELEGDPSKWKAGTNSHQFTLAPATLANPPIPTSMSRAAVFVSCERGIGTKDGASGIPSGMMANIWGSSQWATLNKLQRDEHVASETTNHSENNSPNKLPKIEDTVVPQKTTSISRHRQTVSLGDTGSFQNEPIMVPHEYPSYYPHLLKAHDAQFRLLFPHIPKDENLVFVFRATFSPNDQQDFPGRVFATTRNVYFYSNHFGLVLTSCASLSSITEVTAASGRDCDFLFLHIIPEKGSDIPGRLSIKTFLEPLKILQRRLNFLVHNVSSDNPASLESIFKSLITMEIEKPARTPSMESWEDILLNTSADAAQDANGSLLPKLEKHFNVYVDNTLDTIHGKAVSHSQVSRFRLPTQPVVYEPQGSLHVAAEKYFNLSPKALFLVLFGDKSPVWQLLQHQRRAKNINQSAWKPQKSHHLRRELKYQIELTDIFGQVHHVDACDYQIVDVFNDHLCYVVTDKRTACHLPFRRRFRLVSKTVITHVSKSRCKLAIFTKVEWLSKPYIISAAIERQAMKDLQRTALDLIDLSSDQVKNLGPNATTKKAISIFGNIARQAEVSQITENLPGLDFHLHAPIKQSGLVPLLVETTGSLLQSAVSSLIIWFCSLVHWIWRVTKANKVILLFLTISALINGYHSYRDTLDWWHERNASHYMARLGVTPDRIMGKAVFIRDIDQVITPSIKIETYANSTCYSVFREDSGLASDTSSPISSTSYRDLQSQNAAYRLRSTRERLGTYRHDLLVALKIVNRIEKELIQSEWKRWVQRETRRCRMVNHIINDSKKSNDNNIQGGVSGIKERISERKGDVDKWYQDYCSSCQNAKDIMFREG
ncbi:SNF1-interacting protein [Myotisia sp. PD_48]|nr:SNF1-interacting protein [Myotisia sp. PD_48]